MELEKQVTSLGLSKKLKELGVKQESMFFHFATEIEEDGLAWWNVLGKEPRKGKKVRQYLDSVGRCSSCSAFTVAELGEMLPPEVTIENEPSWLVTGKGISFVWGVGYRKINEFGMTHRQDANTEADARAKMLIYLLENKLIQH